ncbi:cell division protein FtsQ/DivIB [Pseudarthrobacter sp. J1738]|uniref:cell division protein FtsQ/DivIB n=1 Tax=unclassified Pseudarthrobacter TaxID=2647000 RepID=UPI003D2C791A
MPNSSDRAARNPGVLAFPEPKARRRKRYALTALAAVVVLIVLVALATMYSPLLAVRTVAVQGNKLVPTATVQKALQPLEGKTLPRISQSDVDGLLKGFVQIKSSTMQSRPPSTLVVQIQERVPVAVLQVAGKYSLVDADGVSLGPVSDPAKVKLPNIDGGAKGLRTDLFKAVTAVLGALPDSVRQQLASASASSADSVKLNLANGKSVVWGNAEDRELKAKVLEALLKKPEDPKVPVNVYDVSTPRHPVTR